MHFSRGGTIVDVTRSRNLRRKTAIAVGGIFVACLICNYIALIGRISITSDSVQDMTSIDSSFWLSSRIGMNSFNNATSAVQSETSAISPEKTTIKWKEILRNKTNKASSSRIGIHVLRQGKPPTNIIVLGERHSGTTFFMKYLSDCFLNANVRDTFVNNKHWIQHNPEYVFDVVSNDSSLSPSLWRDIIKHNDGMLGKHPPSKRKNQSPNRYFRNSLVIVLFRNPYDW